MVLQCNVFCVCKCPEVTELVLEVNLLLVWVFDEYFDVGPGC